MEELEMLEKLVFEELDSYIVKDTYTKGKNAGLRKCLAMIQDIKDERKKQKSEK